MDTHFVVTITKRVPDLEAAPARFLDQAEELRMGLSNEQLIYEAIECNHAGVGASTLGRWQLSGAEHRPAMRDALSDPEKAYVLMTTQGRKTSPSTVTKIATWHGIRAGVGLKKATPGIDAVDGLTSRVTPHCFRRAWATIALNNEKNPTPIDVVSEVLRHKDIATTRRHYAPTKSDRARAALVGMNVR